MFSFGFVGNINFYENGTNPYILVSNKVLFFFDMPTSRTLYTQRFREELRYVLGF